MQRMNYTDKDKNINVEIRKLCKRIQNLMIKQKSDILIVSLTSKSGLINEINIRRHNEKRK